jgi:hypothetical protein
MSSTDRILNLNPNDRSQEHAQACRPGHCVATAAESQWQQNINFFFKFAEGADLCEIGSAAAFLDMPGLLSCSARIVAATIETNPTMEGLPTPFILTSTTSDYYHIWTYVL